MVTGGRQASKDAPAPNLLPSRPPEAPLTPTAPPSTTTTTNHHQPPPTLLRSPPAALPLQCELNDDDDYWYRSLQREQKQGFAQVIAKLRIEMDMLGGGCWVRANRGGKALQVVPSICSGIPAPPSAASVPWPRVEGPQPAPSLWRWHLAALAHALSVDASAANSPTPHVFFPQSSPQAIQRAPLL